MKRKFVKMNEKEWKICNFLIHFVFISFSFSQTFLHYHDIVCMCHHAHACCWLPAYFVFMQGRNIRKKYSWWYLHRLVDCIEDFPVTCWWLAYLVAGAIFILIIHVKEIIINLYTLHPILLVQTSMLYITSHQECYEYEDVYIHTLYFLKKIEAASQHHLPWQPWCKLITSYNVRYIYDAYTFLACDASIPISLGWRTVLRGCPAASDSS
mgnify:CR=1 FL=1